MAAMTTNPDDREEVRSITEQAAAWRVALEAHDSRRVPEFWQWVTRSPVHVREALVLGLLQQALKECDPEGRIDVEVSSERGMDDDSELPAPLEPVRKERSTRWMVAITVIAACVVLGFALVLLIRSPNIKEFSQTYTTDIGEQRFLTLDDGSTVVLDAQSSLQIRLSTHERALHLEGQALFRVAHDPSRPFRVRAAATTVEAVGTEFNVRTQSFTTVAVLDGTVRLYSQANVRPSSHPDDGPSVERTQLGAGEAVSINGNGGITDRTTVDRATVTAWKERRLVFSRAPLEEIVREFNRYDRKGHLRVEGKAASLRFGGVFDASDPGPLLLILAKNPSVSVERNLDDVTIRDRR
jgi:transmembrane sensor